MIRHGMAALAIMVLTGTVPSVAVGQGRPDPTATLASQRTAIAPLAFMDGAWRGTASTTLPSGEKHALTQTERIGPFLDGTVKVIEGRGYDTDGKVAFNSLGIISFNPMTKAYSMHSYAQGMSGDFALTPSADGFVWTIPAGPMTIRYTATIKDSTWHEVGDRIAPGQEPVRFFEMNLKRIGDTTWPAAGAIPPR